MSISRIISGGQTGADRGALDAAMYGDIPHGGWCPKGRLAEDGVIPPEYRLKETPTGDSLERTRANVQDSDASLIFTVGEPVGGTSKAMEFAEEFGKPWLHIDLEVYSNVQAIKEIVSWLRGETDRPSPGEGAVLNVAGPRESDSPGIQNKVSTILVDVLIQDTPGISEFYDRL